MLEEFENIEIEELGPGKHKEFQNILQRLKEIYIGF